MVCVCASCMSVGSTCWGLTPRVIPEAEGTNALAAAMGLAAEETAASAADDHSGEVNVAVLRADSGPQAAPPQGDPGNAARPDNTPARAGVVAAAAASSGGFDLVAPAAGFSLERSTFTACVGVAVVTCSLACCANSPLQPIRRQSQRCARRPSQASGWIHCMCRAVLHVEPALDWLTTFGTGRFLRHHLPISSAAQGRRVLTALRSCFRRRTGL